MLPILLKPRILSVKNALNNSNSKWSYIILIVLGVLAIPIATYKMIADFSDAFNSTELTLSVIEISLVTFFSVQLLSSAIHSLQSFYLSKDIELILASPISKLRLFTGKFIENLFASSWVLVLLLVPIMYAIIQDKISSVGYLVLSIVFICSIISISAIGIIATLLLSKIYPARSIKEFFLIISIFLVIALHQFGQSKSFFIPLIKENKVEVFTDTISRWKSSISSKGKSFITYPIQSELKDSSNKSRLHLIALFISIMSIFLITSFRIFCDFYNPSEVINNWNSKNKLKNLRINILHGNKYLSFLNKDIHLFLRDIAQPVQLIAFIAIGGITILGLKQTDKFQLALAGHEIWWDSFIATIIVLSHLLFTVLFCGRFVFPALALEEESDWLLKQSPITGFEFVKYKYISVLILSLVILCPTYLALAFSTNLSVSTIFEGLLFCSTHTFTIAACALFSGSSSSFLKFEHLGQMTSGISNFLFMLFSLILIPGLMIISFVFSIFFTAVMQQNSIEIKSDIIFLTVYILFSVLAANYFLNKAANRWSR